jgi:transcriptional regulator with XRE-family HTH domain
LEHIGKNIRLLRQKNGWSQGEVAKKLNISIPAFSKIETNITNINISRLYQIAALFEVSVLELLSLPGEVLANPEKQELLICKAKLEASEQDVIQLQKKVISLFDEVRSLVQSSK